MITEWFNAMLSILCFLGFVGGAFAALVGGAVAVGYVGGTERHEQVIGGLASFLGIALACFCGVAFKYI